MITNYRTAVEYHTWNLGLVAEPARDRHRDHAIGPRRSLVLIGWTVPLGSGILLIPCTCLKSCLQKKKLKTYPPPPSLLSYLISKPQSLVHKPMLAIMLSCCETTIYSIFRPPHRNHTYWLLGLALASPFTALEREKYFVWLSSWWLHVDSLLVLCWGCGQGNVSLAC